MSKRVCRRDLSELGPAERLDNGWLRLDARLTRVGVFEYEGGRREFRPPEEVFDPEALASFSMVPVTDGHPPDMLDASTARQWSAGAVGENVRADGDHVRARMLVTDAGLAQKMDEEGVRALSAGYTVEIDETPGEYMGIPYDAIQRRIRGNHVAVVPVGRAGEGAVARLDTKQEFAMGKFVHKRRDADGEEPTAGMVPFKVGDMSLDVTPEMALALMAGAEVMVGDHALKVMPAGAAEMAPEEPAAPEEPTLDEGDGMNPDDEEQQMARNDAARKPQAKPVQAAAPARPDTRYDALKDSYDAVRKENAQLKQRMDRLEIQGVAEEAERLTGQRFKGDKVQIRRDALCALFPDQSAKIKVASAEYIGYRWDDALEQFSGSDHNRAVEIESRQRTDSAADARAKMVERQREMNRKAINGRAN